MKQIFCLLFGIGIIVSETEGCKNNAIQGSGILPFGDEEEIYMTCDINGNTWKATIYTNDTLQNSWLPYYAKFRFGGDNIASMITGTLMDTTKYPPDTLSQINITVPEADSIKSYVLHNFETEYGAPPSSIVCVNMLLKIGRNVLYGFNSLSPVQDSIGVFRIGGIDTVRHRVWGTFEFVISVPPPVAQYMNASQLDIMNGKFNLEYQK